jgi:hypothetical protein
MTKKTEEYVIVRSVNAGCFAGVLVNRLEGEVVLDQCRRLWYWDGAASLSELAITGPSRPNNCRFPVVTNGHLIRNVEEVIPVTGLARQAIEQVPVWRG